ncbi:MAG: lipoyl synthase [Candidatus Diapherotrites archaeon]|nr:lipoyl synthase [Candidatus Diapherotrites archaeon]
MQLTQIGQKPEWLKIRPPTTEQYSQLRQKISGLKLVTVCQEAHCPNMAECWSGGTATFMVLGDTCTRGCRFCAIKTARKGQEVDEDEPRKLAEQIREMNLKYVVITSVDRDDLEDQGAGHFASCIREIKKLNPGMLVEVLTPDFRGRTDLMQKIIDAKPEVIAQNIETVKRLTHKVRDPRAGYEQTLKILEFVKKTTPEIFTKSSIIAGFGETEQEVLETMGDLRKHGVQILTLGQYLQPSKNHFPLQEYVSPEQFEKYKQFALEKGFDFCASGPFVRSSYKAGELFVENVLKKKNFGELK